MLNAGAVSHTVFAKSMNFSMMMVSHDFRCSLSLLSISQSHMMTMQFDKCWCCSLSVYINFVHCYGCCYHKNYTNKFAPCANTSIHTIARENECKYTRLAVQINSQTASDFAIPFEMKLINSEMCLYSVPGTTGNTVSFFDHWNELQMSWDVI